MRTRAIPRNAAIGIDNTAALNSPSWRLPQLIGFTHEGAAFTGGTTSVAARIANISPSMDCASSLCQWR
jgi:hypothetical protein